MGYNEPEPDGNLDIEVGPLRPPAPSTPPEAATTVRPLLAPQRTRREHLRRGIVVTAGLVVVLVALVLSITPTREALRGVVFGPTPTATGPVSAGEDSLYISLNPAWGAVSLDNRRLARLPLEGVEQPIQLSRGRHTIHWQFAPIIDYSCRLTVPSAAGDTCPTRIGIQPGKKGIATVVALQLALPMLAPGYRHGLIVAMQSAFNAQQSSDIVRPGERYFVLGRGNAAAMATQPLRATLRFVMDAENPDAACRAIDSGPGAGCMMYGDCREICTAPWQIPLAATGETYQAYIVAHATWRYTTLDGQIIADNLPDFDANLLFLGNDERPVPITITWDGAGWHASAHINTHLAGSSLPDPVCATATDEVRYQGILPLELPTQGVAGPGVSWAYVPGKPAAAGCLMAAGMTNAQGALDTSPKGLAVVGLILQRFGVLLAANAAAHRYWPLMPVADAYEQEVAQSLAQQLPAVVGAGP